MKPNIGRAVLGGLVGTLAIAFLMYVGGPMMGLPTMDIAATLGSMLGGWSMGMMMHILNGAVIFPLIYAHLLFGKLPGAPYAKGILWGFSLWLLAQLVVMPMMGEGVFGLKMNGIMSAFGSLMGHVIYGALLGAIAGPSHSAGLERKPVTV
jgi:uncharacterized membrane protein YagU involved in acid resistance